MKPHLQLKREPCEIGDDITSFSLPPDKPVDHEIVNDGDKEKLWEQIRAIAKGGK